MLILTPPSEGKSSENTVNKKFSETDFIFTVQVKKILELLNKLDEKQIISTYGTTLDKANDLHKNNLNIFNKECSMAIERYTGVVFKNLDWDSLNLDSQNYLNKNLRILSGFFGILKPDSLIPNYKLKMNALSLDKYWNPILTKELENNDMILDLLPQIHRKAYRPNQNVIKIDFFHLKQGKTNSAGHLGKSVKGEFIRYLAKNQIKNIKDFQLFEVDGFLWNQGNFVKEIA